ncbi:MAG: tetratricopeptide repeat protein [Saprospiraceae bacterium]|nr:tetratricopeptide repeat protein [Saprospiraceae bacterium]
MSEKKIFISLASFLLLLLIITYWNHFDNDFHFDDSHTIQNNLYIQKLSNIPLFFTKGAETVSNLPANQVYRPFMSTTIAIDYWLSSKFSPEGHGLDTRFYHFSMFTVFVLQLILMFLLFKKIMDKALKNDWNKYLALFAVAFYGFHMVNAETINYIIARSDSYSTFAVIASFVIYMYFPRKRIYGLFLIPVIFGLFTKLTAAMFFPLLIIYFIMFEYKELKKAGNLKLYKQTIYSLLYTFFITLFITILTLKMASDSFTPGGPSRIVYLMTMPYVILHYFISFFVPYSLSADAGWAFTESILSFKFIIGFLFIIGMLYLVYRTYKKPEQRPIAFGILWFFITLLPTSSLIPLAEPMNDHRMFYPFVGLVLSFSWAIGLLMFKWKQKITENFAMKNIIVLVAFIIIGVHAYGTSVRNAVWDNGESLWLDVTIKNPKHGRGLMNYGLSQMRKGDNEKALKYFEEALIYNPYYSYLHVNMGALKDAMGLTEEAETYYKNAISFNPYFHESYYYYGKFLKNHGRNAEAIKNFEKAVEYGPAYIFPMYELMELYAADYQWDKLKVISNKTLELNPGNETAIYYLALSEGKKSKVETYLDIIKEYPTADNYINLSLAYYEKEEFENCIVACEKALEIDPKYVNAYNNICSAYNAMQQWAKAAEACQKALYLQPDHSLAKGNLARAEKMMSLEATPIDNLDFNGLINLSLTYYTEGLYLKCVEACEKALKLKPGDATAYNNICSAYNALQQWDKAIEACEMALKSAPDFELAKNNLKLAEKEKAK